MVEYRRVFYIEGYDPQGSEGYYGLFRSAAKHFRGIWPIKLDVGRLDHESDLIARWDIKASAPNWQTSTRYEFLRLEGMLRANMSQPMWRQVPRALHWMLDDLLSGATSRIFKASWRFAFHLIGFQMMMLTWLELSAAGGWLAAWLAMQYLGAPTLAGLALGLLAAVGVFLLLRPLADKLFVVQINNCWPHLREFASGGASSLRQPLDVFARRIVDAARANDADEIVVIGHSGGGIFAPAVMARALELDPDVGRRGPRLVLLTPGSIMPAAALHPHAAPLRATIERLATEPSILWIDCQSHTDWLNFTNFDPIAGVGINVEAKRYNPLVWPVRFRDMLTPESIKRIEWNLFRKHYQFILGNEKRAPYEYMMLVCGPVPVEQWARRGHEIVESFLDDGSYLDARTDRQTLDAPLAPDHAVAAISEQQTTKLSG